MIVNNLVSAEQDGLPQAATTVQAAVAQAVATAAAPTLARSKNQTGMEMVQIPAGEFIMGNLDRQGNYDTRPQHAVYRSANYIDQTEVTVAQYQRCVEEKACSEPGIGGDYCIYGAGNQHA